MGAQLDDEPVRDEDPQTVAILDATNEKAEPAASGGLDRATAQLRRLRQWASRPSLRPWLLALAALLFLALAVGSFRSLPDEARHIRPVLIAVLVVGATPATLALNAIEYRFMAATLGHNVGVQRAFHVSLVASIANYLPAPGGVAVRTAALRRSGSTVRSAIAVNIVAGMVWLGLTGVVAGLALLANDELALRAAGAAAVGLALLAAAGVRMRRNRVGWLARFGQLIAIELATVAVSAGRLWIALAAIGETASLGEATAISASGVLAALLGIFPAGLGLRELLAGGLAAAVDIPAAAAVAATAVDRVAGQVGMAITALASGVHWSELRRATADSE